MPGRSSELGGRGRGVPTLGSRGVTPEARFQVTGQTPELLSAQIRRRGGAVLVARELVLEAVAEKELAVTDDDVKTLIREQAERRARTRMR